MTKALAIIGKIIATAPDWSAADRAYQLHHTGCATCRAAGAAGVLRELTRQPAGAVA